MVFLVTQPQGDIPTWELGERMAKALRHAGLSKREMAQELGVSETTINNYVSGVTKRVPRAVIVYWAQRTGVALDWLNEHTNVGNDAPGDTAGGNISPRPSGGTYIQRSVQTATTGGPHDDAQAES